MADFKALLEEQKRTNELLRKQRHPLDARTGAGRALLDQQKQTNEKLDKIAEINDASLLEENLSNLLEVINARNLQKQDHKYQEDEGMTTTDDMLGNDGGTPIWKLTSEKNISDAEYQTKSLSLFERMANSLTGNTSGEPVMKEGSVDAMRVAFLKSQAKGTLFPKEDSRAGKSPFAKMVDALKNIFTTKSKEEQEQNKKSSEKEQSIFKKGFAKLSKGFDSLKKFFTGGIIGKILSVVGLGIILKLLSTIPKESMIAGLTAAFEFLLAASDKLGEWFGKLREGIVSTYKFFADEEEGGFRLKVTAAIVGGLTALFLAPKLIAAVVGGILGLIGKGVSALASSKAVTSAAATAATAATTTATKATTAAKDVASKTATKATTAAKDVASKTATKATNIKDAVSSKMKNAGKLLTKGARFIPGVGLFVLAADGVYSAVSGVSETGEIFDLPEGQKATTSQKFAAGAGSIAESLTFGLLKKEDIAKSIAGVNEEKNVNQLARSTRGERKLEKERESMSQANVPVVVSNTNNNSSNTQEVSVMKPLTMDGFLSNLASQYA